MTWENIDNKAEYKTSGKGISYSTGAGVPLNALGLLSNMGPTVKDKAGTTTQSAVIQRNHYNNRQRKPETGHRETEQEHRRQLKQTQRNLRQNKSRRKTGTHPHDEHSGQPNHP